jgi:hypothetical protein
VSGKPTDFTIVLATRMAEIVPARERTGITIVFACNVHRQLEHLGFACSAQQVAAWLKRVSRQDLPAIERSTDGFWAGAWGYRVTQWGRNELWNRGFTDLGKLDASAPPPAPGGREG